LTLLYPRKLVEREGREKEKKKSKWKGSRKRARRLNLSSPILVTKENFTDEESRTPSEARALEQRRRNSSLKEAKRKRENSHAPYVDLRIRK